MPTAGAAEFGIWVAIAIGILASLLGSIVAVLTIINLWKKITSQVLPPAGMENVTAAELERVEKRLRDEIVRVDQERTQQVNNLDKYWRDQFHELREKMQILSNTLALNLVETRKMVDMALAPVMQTQLRLTIGVTRIATRLKLDDVMDDDDEGKT